MDICATHFPDKPDHLTTYEYDVLYPEVSGVLFFFLSFVTTISI